MFLKILIPSLLVLFIADFVKKFDPVCADITSETIRNMNLKMLTVGRLMFEVAHHVIFFMQVVPLH